MREYGNEPDCVLPHIINCFLDLLRERERQTETETETEIERDRERETETKRDSVRTNTYEYVCMYVCICMYVCMHT